jgi:vacuolar ATPase assembly integral membrane protein VMA21
MTLSGNATYGAIAAVFAANTVLIAYIVISILEDRESLESNAKQKLEEKRKDQ